MSASSDMQSLIERIETRVGMGHGAWDMVRPEEIVSAVLAEAASAPLPQEPSMNDQQDKTPEAELVCYEAYQVVGSLLSDIGKFYTPEAQKVLDNLSQARLVHADVLPWPSYESATSAQEARIARLREALVAAEDALSEIALAGMSGTGMESEEGMRDWHARRAWEFIGIAARATEAARAALKETQPGEQG